MGPDIIGHRGSVRLRTVDLDGAEEVITLRLDLEYWPTSELRRGGDGWTRTVLSSPGSSSDGFESSTEGVPAAGR